jgi:hypothetical protein
MKAEERLVFLATLSYFHIHTLQNILVVLASSVAWHSLCLKRVLTIDLQ